MSNTVNSFDILTVSLASYIIILMVIKLINLKKLFSNLYLIKFLNTCFNITVVSVMNTLEVRVTNS